MLCPCGFIKYNKCATLVGNVGNGESYACETGGTWKISLPFPQFCVNLKLFLKNKVFKYGGEKTTTVVKNFSISLRVT